MADWGLYTALRGTDDWKQKRQDKMMNLMVVEKQEQRAQQKQAQSAKLEENIQGYFNELQNLDVLPEDQERVRQEEKNARKKVIAGIATNNGDLKRYMSSGGITDVNEYKNSVMGSEAVKQAGVNKINLQSYLTDRSKGNQRAAFVDVDVPVMGEDGQPAVDENGKPMMRSQKMKFEDQMALFKEGKINKINYQGSETRINVGIEDFSRIFKNPRDPYQKDNYVSESDIYKKAMSKGASEEYARDIAERYGQMYKEGGDAWRWNSKDPYELQLKQGALALKAQKQQAAQKAAQERKTTSSRKLNTLGAVATLGTAGHPAEMPMGPESRKVMSDTFGFTYDKETGYLRPPTGGFTVGDAFKRSVKYDLSQADNVRFEKWVSVPNEDGSVSRYIQAKASYYDPTNDIGGLFTWGSGEGTPLTQTMGRTSIRDEDVTRNWVRDNDGHITGSVLIPVDDQIENAVVKTEINQKIGTSANADFVFASPTIEDEAQKSQETIQLLMDAGYSMEDIQLGLMDINRE